MSLTRTDTGESATPITELEKRSDAYRSMTDTQLLREALAKSNEKCNDLIRMQNMLVSDLTQEVKDLKESNNHFVAGIKYSTTETMDKMKELLQEERKFKAEISQTIKQKAEDAVNDVKFYAKNCVKSSIADIKDELQLSAKEIKEQRAELKLESGFRKFLFWATPILLLAQSIVLIILAIK